MRKLLDDSNTELSQILNTLLADDTTITVREISRRHSTLKNASGFTRNPVRMALIRTAQQRQADARNVKAAPLNKRASSMEDRLEKRSAEVTKLEDQVRALVVSHIGVLKAIKGHGAAEGLIRFWSEYKTVGDTVRQLGAVPTEFGGNVVPISAQT
jgi:hypothetical protein